MELRSGTKLKNPYENRAERAANKMDDDTRTLYEFAAPSLSGLRSGIKVPEVEGQSFEIKPAQIAMFRADPFRGMPNEDPYAHIANFLDLCATFKNTNVPDEAVKLRCFMFTLKDRAKEWERSMPQSKMDTWEKVSANFLERFYPPSKTAAMRHEIANFQQITGEGIHEAWERFKAKVRHCPHHNFAKEDLVQSFYDGLLGSTKAMVDTAAGGALMRKTRKEAYELLERLAENNLHFATERSITRRVAKVVHKDEYADMAELVAKMEEKNAELMTELSKLRTTAQRSSDASCKEKPLAACSQRRDEFEEVNAVNNQNRYPYGNRNAYNNSYNPNWRHPNLSWRNNLPPEEDVEPKKESLEAKMEKFMESTMGHIGDYRKSIGELANSVREMEAKVSRIAEGIALRDKGKFPSSTEVPRPCLKVEMEVSSSESEDGCVPFSKVEHDSKVKVRNWEVSSPFQGPDIRSFSPLVTNCLLKPKSVSSLKIKTKLDVVSSSTRDSILAHHPSSDGEMREDDEEKMKVEKNVEVCLEVYDRLRQHVPHEVIKAHTRDITEFIYGVCEGRRAMEEVHHASSLEDWLTILTRKLPKKVDDPGSISIPVVVGASTYIKAYCDQGSGVNVMSKELYHKLKLKGQLKPFDVSLVFADNSKKQPKGIVENVLIQVHNFHYLADFVVLEMEKKNGVSLLLGRPFLASAEAKIDVRRREINIRGNEDEVTIKVDADSEFVLVVEANRTALVKLPEDQREGRKRSGKGRRRYEQSHEPP